MSDHPQRAPRDGGGGIGVFDSGVGGLTVARALRRKLPEWPITYLGDTARLPYGTKSASTVRRYTERNVRFLVERGVEVVVVACNSASALVIETDGAASSGRPSAKRFDGDDEESGEPYDLREPHGQRVPVVGVIGPGAARAAAVAKQRVGVVATEATIGSDAYPRALRALRPELDVISVACPLLVPLVEENWLDDPVTREVVSRYTKVLRAREIDTLILGCTHYPLLREVFAEVMGDQVTLVDSAEAVSCRVAELLDGRPAASAVDQCKTEGQAANVGNRVEPASGAGAALGDAAFIAYVTDASPRFGRIAEAVMGMQIKLEWIDTP